MEENKRFAIKNEIIKKYYQLFMLHIDLRLIVEKQMQRKLAIDKRNPEECVSVFLFGKSYKTHGVIMELCKEGYGEDAGTLTRALFETAVNILYITQEYSNKRATMYWEHEWVLRKILYESNFELINDAQNITTEMINEVMDNAKEIILKYKGEGLDVKGLNWSGKSIKKMAEEVGLKSAYDSVYAQFSDIAHSRVSARNEYIREDETVFIVDTGPSERLLEIVLVSSFHFFLLIVGCWDKVQNLDIKSQLEALNLRYDTLVTEFNKHQ